MTTRNIPNTIVLFALLQIALLRGQTGAFESLSLSVGVTRNTNQELLHTMWEVHETLEIAAATPFYWGNMQIVFRPVVFSSLNESLNDFQALFVRLGWDYSFNVGDRLKLYAGVSMGNMFMYFSDDINPRESELVFGTRGGLRWQFSSHWGGYIDYADEEVKTHYPIQLVYLTLGCYYSIDMPSILKKFLDP